MDNKKILILIAVVVIAILGVVLVQANQKTPEEKMMDNVSEAVDDMGDAAKDAADDVEDAVKDATN